MVLPSYHLKTPFLASQVETFSLCGIVVLRLLRLEKLHHSPEVQGWPREIATLLEHIDYSQAMDFATKHQQLHLWKQSTRVHTCISINAPHSQDKLAICTRKLLDSDKVRWKRKY